MRSDRRTFAPLLDPKPVSQLRDGLRLLGAKAGAARDTDVLSSRLRAKAGQLPQQDAAGVEELIRRLDSQARAARAAFLDELRSPAYDQLLDGLVNIASQPPIAAEPAGLGGRPAAGIAPGLIRRPWRRLKRAARALRSNSPDTEWHAVRIRAKHCRYAAEAVAPIYGRRAKRFAAAIAALQDLLGSHQDTVVAEAWLRFLTRLPQAGTRATAGEAHGATGAALTRAELSLVGGTVPAGPHNDRPAVTGESRRGRGTRQCRAAMRRAAGLRARTARARPEMAVADQTHRAARAMEQPSTALKSPT
jgi:CHAD domain-containing protein